MTLAARLLPFVAPICLAACASVQATPGVVAAAASPEAAASPTPEPTLSPYVSREAAPNISYYDSSEQRHTLSEHKGHFTLLCFFANFCTFCQKEVPHLQAFQASHPGVDVVAIEATGASKQVVEDFAHSFGVTMPLYHDAARIGAQAFLVTNYPNTYTLDAGLVVERGVLGNVSDGYYENLLEIYGGPKAR